MHVFFILVFTQLYNQLFPPCKNPNNNYLAKIYTQIQFVAYLVSTVFILDFSVTKRHLSSLPSLN